MATKRQEGGPQADPEVNEDEEDAIEESIEVAGVPLVVGWCGSPSFCSSRA